MVLNLYRACMSECKLDKSLIRRAERSEDNGRYYHRKVMVNGVEINLGALRRRQQRAAQKARKSAQPINRITEATTAIEAQSFLFFVNHANSLATNQDISSSESTHIPG